MTQFRVGVWFMLTFREAKGVTRKSPEDGRLLKRTEVCRNPAKLELSRK
jgi:hypothetical protein